MTEPASAELDLAALLCSKLCHDLLSPVGAITNGLELLDDETDPEMRERCLDLLADSATVSANKLKYYRLAFGAAGGFGDTVDTGEIRQLVETLIPEHSKIELGWAAREILLPKKAAKILLNLALIAREALVRGGRLDVGAEKGEQGTEVVVRATGPKIAFDPNIRAALEGSLPAEELAARTAAAWMTRALAKEGGGDLRVSAEQDEELLLGAIAVAS